MNIELSGNFCFSEGPWLTWSDLRFGMSRAYISAEGVVEFAMDSLTTGSDESHFALAGMRGANRWDVDGVLEKLESFAEPDLEDCKAHWWYLLLLWVYKNRSIYDDPLSIVEEIYAEFEYPERMASIIRYMPSDSNYAGGQEKLMENWRSLLEAVAESFVARGRRPPRFE